MSVRVSRIGFMDSQNVEHNSYSNVIVGLTVIDDLYSVTSKKIITTAPCATFNVLMPFPILMVVIGCYRSSKSSDAFLRGTDDAMGYRLFRVVVYVPLTVSRRLFIKPKPFRLSINS